MKRLTSKITRTRTCPACDGSGREEYLSGAMLRDERERAGVSLSALARAAGISKSYLSDLELGRRVLGPKVAAKVLAAMEGT